MGKILCSVSTRGRYMTTLLSVLQSIAMQTRLPDKLVVFDDTDPPSDLRQHLLYRYLFAIFDLKGLSWEWRSGERKGPHYNHQLANKMGFEWVWRVDDDTVAEPDVLEKLWAQVADDVGAVGCSVLSPPFRTTEVNATGRIEMVTTEPNVQWGFITSTREVDHLHCSFLYRAGIVDYNLELSRIAGREETLFTYELKQRGYRLLVTPGVLWHFIHQYGGIRDGYQELRAHDEKIFLARVEALKHSSRDRESPTSSRDRPTSRPNLTVEEP